jgi:carboxypeptidase family protein
MVSVRARLVGSLLLLVATATPARAQGEATIVGSVTDESRAVLPGATVSATDLATGRQFTAVTDTRGEYRLVGLQAGKYRLQAELPGFAAAKLQEVELLVGQNATIVFTMKVATVEETVTVSAASPLVDTRQAQVSGNVDPRQMEDLPLNGRNWLQLSTMIKGITANQITDISTSTPNGSSRTASFRVNLDGQEITQETSVTGFGQPGISRDAIAEYQIVTNMFDVTMGRSVGLQVQAISKAGGTRRAAACSATSAATS